MDLVKTKVPKQTIKVFKEVFSQKKAEEIALENADWAFGLMHNVKSLFVGGANFEITRVEKQYYPFWHIAAENYQEYMKKNNYSFPVDPEVREVKLYGKKIQIEDDPVCHISTEDRCVEHAEKEVLVDASNKKSTHLKEYLGLDSKKIKETEALMGKGKVVIPAETRASFLIRGLFKELMKPINADKIIEERVAITNLVLYFRPVFSMEIENTKTKKLAVIEVDALNGEFQKGHFFGKELKELVDENLLFDLGGELAGALIPGGNIGTIIGKRVKDKYVKTKRKKQMEKSKTAYKEKSSMKKKKR